MTLYSEIGDAKIEEVITEFYRRAFSDQIIGHFFFNHDRAAITAKQINFAKRMLGGPEPYSGQALAAVHRELAIKPAHFGRRQVIMKQTCFDCGIEKKIIDQWMKLEESLRPIIIDQKHRGP